jgi:hypothetical protein
MELRFRKYPMVGSLQTLLRFSLQNLSSKTNGKGIAYLTPTGSIVIRPQKSSNEENNVNKLMFHPSVDLKVVEKRKEKLSSENLELVKELQARISIELVQYFGCSGDNSEKIAGKIIDLFTEYPECLIASRDSTAVFKIYLYEALKALSKGSKTFHSELRDHQKKLKDAKDRISSCSLQINENEKNKSKKIIR